MAREMCFVRVIAGTEDQMASPESKPKELPENTEFFVQAEFLIASDHRDLFVHSLGDDLAVERVLAF